MVFHRITIIRARLQTERDVNAHLQVLGASLGLFGQRDKDKSCFRIFITLLKEAGRDGLTSDELARLTGLSRGTVVFHLNKMIASGIIESHRSHYALAVRNMEALIDKVEHDVQVALEDLRTTAKEIDGRLGL